MFTIVTPNMNMGRWLSQTIESALMNLRAGDQYFVIDGASEDDSVEIAETLLRQFSAEEGKSFRRLSPDAADIFRAHPWPGNVRQLQNVVQRTAALSTTPVIAEALVREALAVADQYLPSLNQARLQFEHDYLVKVLRLTSGSVAEAALLAQRNRTDFYKLLKRHNIEPERFKGDT